MVDHEGPDSMVQINASEVFPKKSLYKEDPDLVVPFFELCGENVEKVGKTNDAVITLSNYRLVIKYTKSFVNVPLGLIDVVECRDLFFLVILCKDGKTFRCKFSTNEQCQAWLGYLLDGTAPVRKLDDLFAFRFYAECFDATHRETQATPPGTDYYTSDAKSTSHSHFDTEIERLGLNNSTFWKRYENTDYHVCQTYPLHHIVPAKITTDEIQRVAKFRSYGRFPSVVWRHPSNGAVIARSSQPEIGLLNWRCREDEKLFDLILQACCEDNRSRRHYRQRNGIAINGFANESNPQHTSNGIGGYNKKVLVMDLRSYTAAYANKLKGGGSEYEEYYSTSEVVYMGLVNIHSIRKSFHNMRILCGSSDSTSWLSKLESTEWLSHLALLLSSAYKVVMAIHKECRPVIIHCTDGWDRTSQVVSLAEILLDPYYRTLEGIQVLIEREWLLYGHKFATRCGHKPQFDEPNGKSPVFLQWLDCLYQLINQFPTAFEFNETFLIKLAQHTYSCLFGTFLCNSDKERRDSNIPDRTCSVWSILKVKHCYLNKNFLFDETTDKVLHPSWNVSSFKFWSKLYMSDLLETAEEDIQPSSPADNVSIGSPKLPRTRSVDELHKAASEEDGRRNSFVETVSLARTSSDPNISDVKLEEYIGTPPKGNYLDSAERPLEIRTIQVPVVNTPGNERDSKNGIVVANGHDFPNEGRNHDVNGYHCNGTEDAPEHITHNGPKSLIDTHLQSSTDTITDDVSTMTSTSTMCNGYHLNGDTESTHHSLHSPPSLKLKNSSTVSTSTSDISNSLIGVPSSEDCGPKRSLDFLSDDSKYDTPLLSPNQLSSDFSITSTCMQSLHSSNKNILSASPSVISSLLCSKFKSGESKHSFSESQSSCQLKIGRHLDEDGLTSVSDVSHQRLVDLICTFEEEKMAMQREIDSLKHQVTLLVRYRNKLDLGIEFPRRFDGLLSDEASHAPNGEDDDGIIGSCPGSINSDVSWEHLEERESSRTLWVPDHAVTHCHLCNSKFSIMCRKHHCRNCGQIFCASCSNYFTPIPREQLFCPERVCRSCHKHLTEKKPQTIKSCGSTSQDSEGSLRHPLAVSGQG